MTQSKHPHKKMEKDTERRYWTKQNTNQAAKVSIIRAHCPGLLPEEQDVSILRLVALQCFLLGYIPYGICLGMVPLIAYSFHKQSFTALMFSISWDNLIWFRSTFTTSSTFLSGKFFRRFKLAMFCLVSRIFTWKLGRSLLKPQTLVFLMLAKWISHFCHQILPVQGFPRLHKIIDAGD